MLVAAALAFLLPFGTVSCDGETVSFTGLELATFSVDSDPTEPDGVLAADVESEGGLLALIALACAIGGAASALLRGRGGGFAVVGVLALLGALSNAGWADELEIHAGYGLSVTALVAGATIRGVARLVARRRRAERIWPWLLAAVPVGLLMLVAAGVLAELIGTNAGGY
jgi:hypothetical protein